MIPGWPHGPDGHLGTCCTYCSRRASTPTSHMTVAWPCPPELERRERERRDATAGTT